VVVVAHNEATVLPRKIKSILHSDCAWRIREVLIASDGSTDATKTVVESCGDPRVRLLAFSERRGKPSVLNDAIPACMSDIVILTDARQELHPGALSELAANFADETVGAVSGELVFRPSGNNTTAAQGLGIYWAYEKFIRKHEGRFRSVPGATGALYAIRKRLFRPIDAQTLLDDVVIPMQAVVQGYRCLFEPAAIVYDTPSRTPEKEFLRKRRTIAGAAQLLVLHPSWVLPWCNPIWLEYISHKLSRLLSPLLLLAIAITNVTLAFHTNTTLASPHVYPIILAVHCCFYLCALTGWVFQQAGTRSTFFAAPWMFLTLNLTTLVALSDAVRGHFRVTWKLSNETPTRSAL
jgi:cellulose synthase/poly-beta-1,6-N-acetylglucosamine synthase-like glycosyltransferase